MKLAPPKDYEIVKGSAYGISCTEAREKETNCQRFDTDDRCANKRSNDPTNKRTKEPN